MPEPIHEPDRRRFSLTLDHETAEFTYRLAAAGSGGGEAQAVMIFNHVFVPPAYRGRGVADRLAKFAFDHAAAEGWRVRATCPYLTDAWLPRHPEAHHLLA